MMVMISYTQARETNRCGGNGNDMINGEDGDDRLVGDSFVCESEIILILRN